jgi:hypothetical protein
LNNVVETNLHYVSDVCLFVSFNIAILQIISINGAYLLYPILLQGKQPSKEDKFEYVTHGKLYKIDKEGSGADFKLYVPYL